MFAPATLVATLASLLGAAAGAKSFLEIDADAKAVAEAALLWSEVESTWAPGFAQQRLVKLEAALEPMYTALPKNENGKLGIPVARYALHRLFEQMHSWYVKGLHPGAGGRNSSSSADPLGLVAPEALQGLLSDLGSHGLALHELAVLAAALEANIHAEASHQLSSLYSTLGKTSEVTLDASQLAKLVDEYMTIYISGAKFLNVTAQEVEKDTKFMLERTSGWKENQDWMRETRENVMTAEKLCREGADCSHNFNTTLNVTEEVVQKYGSFNDKGCQQLKTALLKIEDKKSGRVPLASFYKEGLAGVWEFNEKVEYLRALGALDESVPNKPRVIVPNYVSSWVNCLTSSKFYAVCCRSECEDILGYLERQVAAPYAESHKLLELITALPKDVVSEEPRKISELLVERLGKIAAMHQGTVPLHGRLFAQWLHHVFPRSCPYPREVGTSNPQTADEWMQETGHTGIKASPEEITRYIGNVAFAIQGDDLVDEDDSPDLPWSDSEELLVIRPSPPSEEPPSYLLEATLLVEVVASLAALFAVLWAAKLVAKRKKVQSVMAEKLRSGCKMDL